MNINQSCTYISDLDTSLSHVIGIEKLYNTSVLITGATGTIGSYLSDMLIRFLSLYRATMGKHTT